MASTGQAPISVDVRNVPLPVTIPVPVPVDVVKLPAQYELKIIEITPIAGQSFDVTLANKLKPETDAGFLIVSVVPTSLFGLGTSPGAMVFLQRAK